MAASQRPQVGPLNLEPLSRADAREGDLDVALFTAGMAEPRVLERAYREMRRLRMLDARMVALQRQGKIGHYTSGAGDEAVAVAVALAIAADDWVFPAQHEQALLIARGFPMRTWVQRCFGASGDPAKGRQPPGSLSSRDARQVSGSMRSASQLLHAVGAAWAMRTRRSPSIAVAFVDEAGTRPGGFHAAMNLAGVWKAPCVVVCHTSSVGAEDARPGDSRTVALKSRAYGVAGIRVDACDLSALHTALEAAAARARSGQGATLVEAVRTPGDALARLRAHLATSGAVSDASDAAVEGEIAAEIDEAVREAEGAAPVRRDSLFEDVYAEVPPHLAAAAKSL